MVLHWMTLQCWQAQRPIYAFTLLIDWLSYSKMLKLVETLPSIPSCHCLIRPTMSPSLYCHALQRSVRACVRNTDTNTCAVLTDLQPAHTNLHTFCADVSNIPLRAFLFLPRLSACRSYWGWRTPPQARWSPTLTHTKKRLCCTAAMTASFVHHAQPRRFLPTSLASMPIIGSSSVMWELHAALKLRRLWLVEQLN